MPWAFGGTRMALDHSLTHSLTHSLAQSILINLFIKVRLNTLPLPPLLSIIFVSSAFYAYVWHRVLVRRTFQRHFFSTHHRVASLAEDGFCINGNILKNTDNIIGKKWTWSC